MSPADQVIGELLTERDMLRDGIATTDSDYLRGLARTRLLHVEVALKQTAGWPDQTDSELLAGLPEHRPAVFIGYRPAPPAEYQAQGAANAPDEPQYEGCLYTDGSVVIRWLTAYRSHSVWSSYVDFYRIHGHPEYGTRIDWYSLHDAPQTPA